MSLRSRIFTISSIGSILLMLASSKSYAKDINSYEDYRLYCNESAYQYGVASPECDSNESKYSTRLEAESFNNNNVSLADFESIYLNDWRYSDEDIPWSVPVMVESDFGNYFAVFDKNFQKGMTFTGTQEYGIESRWGTEELSIFYYQKVCVGMLGYGCRKQEIPVGRSIEILVDDSMFKLYGENGVFPISHNLKSALRKSTYDTYITLRINGSDISDIGEETSESLGILYSFDNSQNKSNLAIQEKISVAQALPENTSRQKIVGSTVPGVVKIETNSGSGTGFIIGDTGLILTNRHVVSGDNKVDISFYDGTQQQARVVARDSMADIAVLRVNSTHNMKGLPLCHAQYPSIGEDVIAIGNPLGLNFTVTRGIVSGIRQMDNQSLIQTDAPVNPGNSGGPLLNQHGEVIGIINAKKSAMGIEGIGFAVPIIEALNNMGIEVETVDGKSVSRCGNPIAKVIK